MSIVRNLALMGTSTAMRLAFGMLTFVVMARVLGPAQFGVVMLWLSVATLLALIANYGLTPYVLREIGAAPETAPQVMAEVLSAKLLLTLVVLAASLAAMPLLDGAARLVFLLLLGAQLADALTDFLNVGFRATNRFADETRIASLAVLLQFAIVTLLLWWLPTPLMAAASFLLSRLAVLLFTWHAQRRYFATLRPAPVRRAWARIMATRSYAVDFGLQSLLGQVDSVVLNHFVGPAAVGLYQAGMRLFNGGAQAASVLANVFLPRAAAAAQAQDSGASMRRESARVQWAFVGVGLMFGLVLCTLAEPIVMLLFGAQYKGLIAVLPWFGLLFFVRFFASSWGVLLTSAGAQRFRAVMNMLNWSLVGLLSIVLVPRLGLIGWLLCLTAGNALLASAYVWRGQQLAGAGWRQPALATLALAGFLPFLHVPQ
ncbi:MAG: oligosaccharide flippase family protein [Roseateles sp.]